MEHAVVVANASKIFNSGQANQVDALVDVSLTVGAGEFVALIGHRGAASQRCCG